ncbi:hypothetical protein, partial [Klebsiella pneumoniae]|uniref:hypothetical protein n=1 Tax=Klebsiella pneumoniae TaxID=573 RepID=UPI002731DCCF
AVRNELGNGVSVIGPITKADGKPGQGGVGLGGVRLNFRLDTDLSQPVPPAISLNVQSSEDLSTLAERVRELAPEGIDGVVHSIGFA